jgi:hypothetical protein
MLDMLWEQSLCKEENHYAIILKCFMVESWTTYDKELYAIVQVVKNWKHYLMEKETIIHTDH